MGWRQESYVAYMITKWVARQKTLQLCMILEYIDC